MKKPDFDYYRKVVSTQHDPDILQGELKDLINESAAYIEKADGSKVPCSVGVIWRHPAKEPPTEYQRIIFTEVFDGYERLCIGYMSKIGEDIEWNDVTNLDERGSPGTCNEVVRWCLESDIIAT